VLQQQARFDAFFERYNHERAQEAPAIQVLRAVYSPSPRPYRGLPDLAYPLHDWIATVTQLRADLLIGRKINLSQVLAGQNVGVKQMDEHPEFPGFRSAGAGETSLLSLLKRQRHLSTH
jgi:putative transposase